METREYESIRDVTEEENQEKLKYLATIDSLSGIYNRAEFMVSQRELDRANE